MKALNFIVTIVALLGLLACGRGPVSPAPDAAAEVVESNLSTGGGDYVSFIGKAYGLIIEVQFIDNYFSEVVDGNHYDNSETPLPAPQDIQFVYTVKAQVKITDFSYYGNPVDIICEKDHIDNKLELLLTGTGPDGEEGSFYTDGTSNDLFYFMEALDSSATAVQGLEHEIHYAELFYDDNDPFFCKGYVNGIHENNYEVLFYQNFQYFTENNLNIQTIFSMEDRTLEGVISIRKRNGYLLDGDDGDFFNYDEYVDFFLYGEQ